MDAMNVYKKVLITVILAGLSANVFAAAQSIAEKKPVEGTQGYRDEINRPPEPYKGPPRTGEQVYVYRCAACHAKTTQGAPMPGDDIEWGMRAKQGMKVLMQHTVEGYNQLLMPPRGGCGNCSDAELKAAVVYMLEKSDVKPPQP
jgi:cytochrome c5